MKATKVTTLLHPDKRRGKRWQVCWRDAKKHRRSQFFATEDEAEVFAEARRTEIQNFGLSALALTDAIRRDTLQAMDILL